MTLQSIASMVAAPIFFFLSIVLFLMTFVFLKSAYLVNPAFLVLSCLIFVLGYNFWMIGLKIKRQP
jgi:hypothetical protein